MSVRPFLRRTIPLAVRWRIRFARRYMADALAGTRFASRGDGPKTFPYLLARYERPIIRYPGQETAFPGKRRNIELACRGIDGVLLERGETFSFWRCVGRPTEPAGYLTAAAIKNGILTEEVGGAVCLVSTLLYNIGLLGGMTIVERRCHSVDSYGDDRYFELGRDAAVEFAYLDLRFRNDWDVPILLRAHAQGETLVGEAWTASPLALAVSIDVSDPTYESPATIEGVLAGEASHARFQVRTRRTVHLDGDTRIDDLGLSIHVAQPTRERASS